MTTTLLRAGALACALMTTTALTAPALAQSSEPAHRAVDANGVDLISGTFPFSFAEGTIGAGEGALSVERHGVTAEGTGNWQNVHLSQTISGSVTTVTIVFGDRSERFTSTSGGAFVAAQGNGAALTGGNHADFVYTDAAGVVTTFGAGVDDQSGASNLCSHANANQNGCYALATSVVRPNAAEIDFGWDVHPNCATAFNQDGSLDCTYTWRLDTVGNSLGYGIDFSYVSDSVSPHQNPSGNWFKRNGAILSNGSTTRSISYNFISSTVTEITDANSRVWRLTNGTNSLGIRRPGSSSDDISVSFSAGIVTAVTRDGIATNYSRSVTGNSATTTITNALSQVTIVVADTSLARITSVTDPLSRQTSYQYDGSGRLTRLTQPEGNSIGYTYDSRGNVTEMRIREKDDTGDTTDDIVTSATYASTCGDPSCNQPLTTVDANGQTADYTYDSSHGGLLTATGPAPASGADRPQARYSYTLTDGEYRLTGISACSSGTTGSSPSCVDTANETRIVIGYDGAGNVTSVERHSGNASGPGAVSATTSASYDAVGNLLTIDGPLSGSTDTTRFRYNAAREPIGVIGPDPDGGGILKHRAVRTSYDNAGRVASLERGTVDSQSDGDWANFAGLEAVETEYDSNHLPAIQRLVSGSTTFALTQTSYDGLGRVQCVAQRMNPSEFASLPTDACTLDTEGSFGADRIVRATYDDAGQTTLVQTGYGVSGVQADEVASAYTNNGRVQHVTDAEGNRTTYEYDGFDRLVKTRMPSPTTPGTSSTTDYEQLTLDAIGNVTNRRLRDNSNIAFTYDALGRLTERDIPEGAYAETDIVYTYDLLGRMLTATSDHGHVVTFAYDALGRTVSETGPMGQKAMQYDLAGRLTRLTWPDSFYVDYVYNTAGDMTEVRENGATSGPGLLATFAYDDRGRRTSLTRGNGTVTGYTYDNVSRLTELVQNLTGTSSDLTLGFSHNPAGQIATNSRSNDAYSFTQANTNVSGTPNGLNQLTAVGGASISYDAHGNLSNDGARSYAYTSENRLAGAGNSAIFYEPLGRPHQLYHYDGTTEHFTRFDNLGGTIVSELNLSTSTLRRYVPGPGIDEPLVWYEGSGTSDRRWLHADERGSIVAVSDDDGDLIGARNRYDEYGNAQGALTGRFGYTGQTFLPEIGIYHYRARAYNPDLGRFMQADPIGYGSGMNLYAYVFNDPIGFTDPFGLNASGLCRDVETTWVHIVWSDPQGSPPGKITDKWLVVNTLCDSPQGPNAFVGGFGSGGAGGTQPDRCAAKVTPPAPGGEPAAFVDIHKLAALAQLKFLQHSWPIGFDRRSQSTFGGIITSGASLAEAAGLLIATRTHVPTGGLNVRITGDIGSTVGRDIRSFLATTSYLTVILGPPIGRPNGLPERVPVSIYPGCP